MKIYLATSWRNPHHSDILYLIKHHLKYEVYDFKNPVEGDIGFNWREIDPNWQNWTPEEYRDALRSPVARKSFSHDINAIDKADVVVALQPFGISTALELGRASGAGKKTVVYLRQGEPELMLKMADHICISLLELEAALNQIATELS